MLNCYKQCSKYIHKYYPKLFKREVYKVMKRINDEKYCSINKLVLDFWELLGNQQHSIAVTMSGITIDHDINGTRNNDVLLENMIQKER
jgi:hypothetical protein